MEGQSEISAESQSQVPILPMEGQSEISAENQSQVPVESQNQAVVQQKVGASFSRTCLNGINSLTGIGILSMPYAISKGGWLSLVALLMFALMCSYTGILMQRLMTRHPRIKSYPDIGEVAFGSRGRTVIAIFTYVELFLVCVELLILEGDNFDKLFSIKHIKLGHLTIEGKKGFIMLAALIMLPTTWLRNLGVLAYVSFAGIVVSIILVVCIVWVGIDGAGFHRRGQLVHWEGLLNAVCLFAFNYGAHAVMPTLCYSMNDRRQFSKVLMVCFATSTFANASIAVLGYTMFGNDLKSQITLNLPTDRVGSKIAIYTTIINPFTKYVVLMTPIANAIENRWQHLFQRMSMVIFIRTVIVVTTVLVALFLPFYEYIMAFIGAFSVVAISLLFPCICYLKINQDARQFGIELMVIIAILLTGTSIGIGGTYLAVRNIVKHL